MAIGLAIVGVGLWGVRLLARPAPHASPDDVIQVAVDYRCAICGLQLTVTHSRDEEVAAPRHCREPMEPV